MKLRFYFIAACFLLNTTKSISQLNKSFLHSKQEYAVTFPFQIKTSTQTIHSTFGPLNSTMYGAEVKNGIIDKNLIYSVIETDYPDSIINSDKKDSIDQFFKSKINEIIQNSGGTLIKESENKLNGYPSRTIEVDFMGGLIIFKMKLALRKNKLIIAGTMTKKENYPNSESDIFLNSLIIK